MARVKMHAGNAAFEITITQRHEPLGGDEELLRRAAIAVLTQEGIRSAEISVVLTDDAEIQRINREFLGHDFATDVISFLLNDEQPPHPNPLPRGGGEGTGGEGGREAWRVHLEGELVISVETARRAAERLRCSLDAELVLYVVHGLLHLCGYDDLTDDARPIMRRRETELMNFLKVPQTGNDEPV